MSEEHLDLLSLFAGVAIGIGVGESSRDVARGLVDTARNLPIGSVWAAARFQRTALAVSSACAIEQRAIACRAARASEVLAARAFIAILLWVELELGTADRAVRALRLVPHRHMRLDFLLLN